MPAYQYKAKRPDAQTVTGQLTARDADEAVDRLLGMDLLPVSVTEASGPGRILPEKSGGGAVKVRDLLAFTKQLSGLQRSGVALLKSLEILSQRTRPAGLAAILGDMAQKIRNGRSFSAALQDHPQVFPGIYASMVRAGEDSGKLREMLDALAAYYRKQEEISTRIRAALVYPAFMAAVGTATVVFILTFVMPRITVLFRDLRTELPLATVLVMRLSEGVQHSWPLLAAGAAVFLLFLRTAAGRRTVLVGLRRLFSVIPGVGDLPLKVDLERFLRTLGLLLDSGIPILKAMDAAVPTVSDERLRRELKDCQTRVEGGVPFAQSLAAAPRIPEILPPMVAVGEESGQLGRTLRDIAETYEEEITETTRSALTLLEPLLILAVGLVVGFLVFAMLMPVFQMDVFAR